VHGKVRVYSRAVDVFLLLTWLPATFSGIILWETLGIVPEARERSGCLGTHHRPVGQIHFNG
jgi:hypothetical protein